MFALNKLLLSKVSSDAVRDGISYLVSSLAEIRVLSQSTKSKISKKQPES
jgi:hypothetical protein